MKLPLRHSESANAIFITKLYETFTPLCTGSNMKYIYYFFVKNGESFARSTSLDTPITILMKIITTLSSGFL